MVRAVLFGAGLARIAGRDSQKSHLWWRFDQARIACAAAINENFFVAKMRDSESTRRTFRLSLLFSRSSRAPPLHHDRLQEVPAAKAIHATSISSIILRSRVHRTIGGFAGRLIPANCVALSHRRVSTLL